MKTIITIIESPAMPGRYTYTMKQGKKVLRGNDAGSDPAAAAAKAVDLAIAFPMSKGYVILGPEKVLQHIPKDIRSNEGRQ